MKKIIYAMIMGLGLTISSYGAVTVTDDYTYANKLTASNLYGKTAFLTRSVFTNTTPVAVSASSAFNFIIAVSNNAPDIMVGRWYVNTTNRVYTSGNSALLDFYSRGNRLGEEKIITVWNDSDNQIASSIIKVSAAAGATNILVTPALNYVNQQAWINTLLYIGGTSEFVRVKAQVGSTNMILMTPLIYGHNTTCVVSTVKEFTANLYDASGSNNVYGIIRHSTNTTANFGIDLIYK
jgi:hypothetical protein